MAGLRAGECDLVAQVHGVVEFLNQLGRGARERGYVWIDPNGMKHYGEAILLEGPAPGRNVKAKHGFSRLRIRLNADGELSGPDSVTRGVSWASEEENDG